jgi:hypothetical protein
MARKPGFTYDVPEEFLTGLAEAFEKEGKKSDETIGVRGVRQKHAQPNDRISRGNKKRVRRGKSSKGA